MADFYRQRHKDLRFKFHISNFTFQIIKIMANRRTLKKQIRAILGQLMDECIICNLVLPKFDNTTLDTFAARIIEINDEFIARANHPEGTKDRKRTKQYYSALVQDFNKATLELIQDMNKISE
jgi:hypothetical protein